MKKCEKYFFNGFLVVLGQNQGFWEKLRKSEVVFGMRQGFRHTLIHENILGAPSYPLGPPTPSQYGPKNEIFKESHNFGQFLDEKSGFGVNHAVFAWFMA